MTTNTAARKTQIMDALHKANGFRMQRAADKRRIHAAGHSEGLGLVIELLELKPAVPPWWFAAPISELLRSVKYVGKDKSCELCRRASAIGANVTELTKLGRLTERQRALLVEVLKRQKARTEKQ